MKITSFTLLLLTLLSLDVLAGPRLILWHPKSTQLNVILPALEGETPAQAVQKYVNAMNETKEFRYEMMNGATVKIPDSEYGEFHQQSKNPSFVVLANELSQVEAANYYMNLIVGLLNEKQAEPFVLPVGADFRMSAADRLTIKSLINSTFDAELAIGGDDVDPAMYHEENQFAHKNEIHPLRDQLEAAFISSYVKDGKGIFYAFCRGHQLTGVTQGSRLIQDLYAEHVTETEHRGGTFHKIKIQPGSLMSRMTGGLSEVTVNSLHHQAVDGAPKGWIVSAQEQGGGSSKPVIETLENKSKCAITFQFHPEGMNDGIGGKILWEMVQYARETHLVGRPKQVNH